MNILIKYTSDIDARAIKGLKHILAIWLVLLKLKIFNIYFV